MELPLRSAENSRNQQCLEETLTVTFGAQIKSISGGGSLSNSSRMVQREESPFLNTHQLGMGRQSSFDGPCSDSQMCPGVLDDHKELRVEGHKLSRVSPQPESTEECNMGDVAGDGLECHGGDRELTPNH